MFTDEPEDYIISNDDIRKIRSLEKSPLPLFELSKDDLIGSPAVSLKLIALLSYFGHLHSLRALSDAKFEKNKLSEFAELEVTLYLCAVRGSQPSENMIILDGVDISWIIKGNQNELVAQIRGAGIIFVAIVLKYLCMWGHTEIAKKLISDLDPHVANCVLNHLLSISTLFGKRLTRPPEGEMLNRWNSFYESTSQIFVSLSKKDRSDFKNNYIHFLSQTGSHNNALALAKKYKSTNPLLYASVRMQKALSDKKIPMATKFADFIILTQEPARAIIDQAVPFDRNVAETALCEVNSILRGAGVDVFIISGTLLGFVRDGRILEHDKDFDLGIVGWEDQFAVAQALFLSPNFSFSPKGLKGHELFLLSAVHVPTGYSFDVFFFHENGHTFKHGIQTSSGYTIHYEFSKFNLIEKEFLGQNFLVPEDYELFLEENYGTNWRTPDPGYFVKLESPALMEKSGDNFAYSIRHEMLDMLGNRASPDKGRMFVEKMKLHAQPKDQPKPSVVNAFLRKLNH